MAVRLPHLCLCALLCIGLSASSATAGGADLAPTHYDLAVAFNYVFGTLEASARIDLVNDGPDSADVIPLRLYRLLRVTSVIGADGEELPFAQVEAAYPEFTKLRVNEITVRLDHPIEPGGSATISVDYAGPLEGYADTGMHYIQDRVSREFTIFREDCLAYPEPGLASLESARKAVGWRYTYDARFTVPSDLVVANGGRLLGVAEDGGRHTYHYCSLQPSWRMDFAVASYKELTAGPVRVFYLDGDGEGAKGVSEAARKALGFCKEWFGPLKSDANLTFIEIPDGWGSQTDVSTIIQSAAAFRDPSRHHEVYHEVTHLWNVPSSDVPSPRLEEGLASFLEYLIDERVSGSPVVDSVADARIEKLRKELGERPALATVPLELYGSENLTDFSYNVGALFFDLLYRTAGASDFNRIISDYDEEHRVEGGSVRDLIAVIDRVDAGAASLCQDWLLTTQWTERIAERKTIQDLAAYYRSRG